MWEKVQSSIMPDEIDISSSSFYNYVRKNIVKKTDDDGNAHFEFDELKIPKEAWPLYEQYVALEKEHQSTVKDLEVTNGAIQELSAVTDALLMA